MSIVLVGENTSARASGAGFNLSWGWDNETNQSPQALMAYAFPEKEFDTFDTIESIQVVNQNAKQSYIDAQRGFWWGGLLDSCR